MSFSGDYTSVLSMPIATLQYRDIGDSPEGTQAEAKNGSSHAGKRGGGIEISEAEFVARIRQERADAAAQAEQKLRQENEQRLLAARSPIPAAIEEFAQQREDYFARVEAEIVQLSLSIAAKILHREAQVDPMLVATLVRIAVERMREESSVTVHVGAGCGSTWKQYFAGFPNLTRVEVVEDSKLSDKDCVLETELGSANFGLDTQLKEVEQGFFDLLALRPANR
ncbi:MAG: FliH/SctL family protein [Terracidiphilus sp.]